MAIHKLSRRQIAKLTKNGMYGDGGNLWLQVTGNGTGKSWIFRWTERSTGRERVMGLGPLHTVDLETARQLALTNRQLLLARKDPKAERDGRVLDDQIARGLAKTVRQIVDEYFEAKIARQSVSTRRLARHLFTIVNRAIGDWPIQKVDRKTIFDKLNYADMWAQKHETAKRLQGYLFSVFKYAQAMGYYTNPTNPAARYQLEPLLPRSSEVHKVKHFDAMPYKEIGRFMEKLRAYRWRARRMHRYEGRPPPALCLEFMILSGVRHGEVRQAQWKEFDLERMIWNVPAEHRKTGDVNGEVRQVPITKPMLDVLEQAKQIAYPKDSSKYNDRHKGRGSVFKHARHEPDTSPDALVFPSVVNQVIDPPNIARFMRQNLNERKATPHGFRSTLRDWMRAETSFDDVLWHIQADHTLGDRTSQAYGHDKLLDRRRAMMELWAEYCSKLAPKPKPGEVVKLASKRRSINAHH